MANNSAVSVDDLRRKANVCLSKKVDMPMSPLWNMGRAAKYNSSDDLAVLQEALDYLTCKAREKLEFSEDDKEFLKEVYEAFWWGGMYKGYKEAAALANHYVNGDGALLRINAEVYKTSKIVQATSEAMKEYIRELNSKGKDFSMLKCNNPVFMSRPYSQPLRRMNFRTEGKMKASGVLEAAQDNHRLHKTDGHFFLEARSSVHTGNRIRTIWSVESIYDFEPFEKQDYYTEIPLGQNKLVIYDGLSEYMTKIGVAKVFTYKAEWEEIWGN